MNPMTQAVSLERERNPVLEWSIALTFRHFIFHSKTQTIKDPEISNQASNQRLRS